MNIYTPFIIDAFLFAHRSRCGVLVLGSADEQLYASKAYTNDVALGVRTVKYDWGSTVRVPRTAFPEGVKTGPAFEDSAAAPVAYLNLDSGWAASARGVEILMARVIALGGKVIGGKAVAGLVREDCRTTGVSLADGSSVRASLVVIASGSWTASTFRELALGERCISTG
jgi:sarcosine oxidase/L-pipecolate oxidase